MQDTEYLILRKPYYYFRAFKNKKYYYRVYLFKIHIETLVHKIHDELNSITFAPKKTHQFIDLYNFKDICNYLFFQD